MSFKFPLPRYSGGVSKLTQIKFGGYDHRESCSEGSIFDMKNLTADNYPVLSVRQGRVIQTNAKYKQRNSLGAFLYDNIFLEVDTDSVSSTLYIVTNKGTLEYSLFGTEKRSFCAVADKIVIFPDKKYFAIEEITSYTEETAPKLYDMEAWIMIEQITFGDGTYAGLPAKANSITFSDGSDLSVFRVGDAVTISGCTTIPENNKTVIIEEIEQNKLIFLENTFTMPDGKTEYSESGEGESRVVDGQLIIPPGPTVVRKVPDLEHICVQDNRLWGASKDSIYVSRLGDPLNFNNFQGDGGSYALDVISPGDFTGIYPYLGYVVFFKEDDIYKIYGTRPSNFQLSRTFAPGVKKGSAESIANVGGTLFYHSRYGIMAYSGGSPYCISECFGNTEYKNAKAASDGIKYYVSLEGATGQNSGLFVYDTRENIWMKENDETFSAVLFNKAVCLLSHELVLYSDRKDLSPDFFEKEEYKDRFEGPLASFAEFGDFYNSSPNKKAPLRLQARIELEEGAEITFFIQYDSSGEWDRLKKVSGKGKGSHLIPMRLRRCDHYRLKIEGIGQWKLFSLAREGYTGSEI